MSSEDVKELIATLAKERQEQALERQQYQQEIKDMIQLIQGMPGVNTPVSVTVAPTLVDNVILRANKVQQMALALRKSNKIRDFKHTKDSNIRKYLNKFDEEIKSLKVVVGIDDDLAFVEYIPLLRASLDFHVIKRVEEVFVQNPNSIKT